MSTKNHKAATISDILKTVSNNPDIHQSNNPPTTPSSPTNPPIHKSNNPFALRARCGNVARLPKEIRDQLNEMLLDGVPHHQIIQKLRANFAQRNADIPAGPQATVDDTASLAPSDGVRGSSSVPESDESSHNGDNPCASALIENQNGRTSLVSKIENLTPRHITNWKKFGGYRDWLRDQQRIEECKLRHELTLDLARNADGLPSTQPAPKVAVAEICQTIVDLGPEGLKEAMQASPMNCFRLLNALARLINSGLKCEQQIQKTAIETNKQKEGSLTRTRLRRIEGNLNLF